MTVLVSISSLLEMKSKFVPQAHKVVSFSRLKVSVSFLKRSKSLIKILKMIGSSIDFSCISRMISRHSLKNKPTFTLSSLYLI